MVSYFDLPEVDRDLQASLCVERIDPYQRKRYLNAYLEVLSLAESERPPDLTDEVIDLMERIVKCLQGAPDDGHGG